MLPANRQHCRCGACSAFGGTAYDGETRGRETRRRWEDYIKMDLHEVGCGGMNWIELAEDRGSWRALTKAVMNLLVP